MVSPAKVVKVNSFLVELFRQVAETRALVNSIPTVRVFSWLLQAENTVNMVLFKGLDDIKLLDDPAGRSLGGKDRGSNPVAIETLNRVVLVCQIVLVFALLAPAEMAQKLDSLVERHWLDH